MELQLAACMKNGLSWCVKNGKREHPSRRDPYQFSYLANLCGKWECMLVRVSGSEKIQKLSKATPKVWGKGFQMLLGDLASTLFESYFYAFKSKVDIFVTTQMPCYHYI